MPAQQAQDENQAPVALKTAVPDPHPRNAPAIIYKLALSAGPLGAAKMASQSRLYHEFVQLCFQDHFLRPGFDCGEQFPAACFGANVFSRRLEFFHLPHQDPNFAPAFAGKYRRVADLTSLLRQHESKPDSAEKVLLATELFLWLAIPTDALKINYSDAECLQFLKQLFCRARACGIVDQLFTEYECKLLRSMLMRGHATSVRFLLEEAKALKKADEVIRRVFTESDAKALVSAVDGESLDCLALVLDTAIRTGGTEEGIARDMMLARDGEAFVIAAARGLVQHMQLMIEFAKRHLGDWESVVSGLLLGQSAGALYAAAKHEHLVAVRLIIAEAEQLNNGQTLTQIVMLNSAYGGETPTTKRLEEIVGHCASDAEVLVSLALAMDHRTLGKMVLPQLHAQPVHVRKRFTDELMETIERSQMPVDGSIISSQFRVFTGTFSLRAIRLALTCGSNTQLDMVAGQASADAGSDYIVESLGTISCIARKATVYARANKRSARRARIC